jgi:hypothetical protein
MDALINLGSIGVFALMIYGLTRDKGAQPWGRWLAGGCAAVLLVVMITSPDDGCSTDWDGRSNPVVCD